MKNKGLLIAMLAIGFSGCGQGPTGPQGAPASTGSSTSMNGYYTMPNGGYVGIAQQDNGLYSLTPMYILVTNADGSTGYLPFAGTSSIPLVNNQIIYTGNITYAAGNNVKQDSNAAVLTASYFTEITVSLVSGELNVNVIINSANAVLFNHTVIQ